MASYVTHYYAAQMTAKLLDGDAQQYVAAQKNCFYLGAQGADLLFYAFGKFKGYGVRTHKENTYSLFCAMLDFCKQQKRADLLAYLFGFCCHYCLDKNSHPYVIHTSETRMKQYYPPHLEKCLHMMLEARLDFVVATQKTNYYTRDYVKEAIRTGKQERECFADMWAGAINPLFSVKIRKNLLKKLPVRMRKYQSVFVKPHCVACRFLKFASKKLGYPNFIEGFFMPEKAVAEEDWENKKRDRYPQYVGAQKTMSCNFDEIISDSVNDSISLINHLCECYKHGLTPDKSYFDINFSGHKN